MQLCKIQNVLSIILIALCLACGKDRDKAPSNREGYTDGSIASPDAPPAKDEAKPAPGEGESIEDGTSYVVEVGSFDSAEAALKFSQELRQARINNDIQSLGGKKFRVVVGRGFSRSRAEKMLEKIIEAGYGNAKVVSATAS
jgi:cell division protein FtsN